MTILKNDNDSIEDIVADDYRSYNAKISLLNEDGKLQLEEDQIALNKYFKLHVNKNLMKFDTLDEKLDFLVNEGYYEGDVVAIYDRNFIKKLFKLCYSYNFRFNTFMGAIKFFNAYALKTFDGKKYLETYEDRVAMNALFLGDGDEELALSIVREMMTRRYQPATPTFLNAGKKQRGGFTSCFLLSVEDNLESINRSITNSMQLSKRGGGVALCISNLREKGAPIKMMENQSSGVIPVMKLYEDAFKYANQLGQRQGAGAVYLHAHHPDILDFLDTKKENADEAVRIKTLSLGVVIPDITYELAKKNADMYLFSPYDVERVYNTPFVQINVTEKYDEMVADDRIRKTKINARDLFTRIAQIQFESGYPYIMNEDTANRAHNNSGKIFMSNLCSEIAMTASPSTYKENNEYDVIGRDISCNLGSMNIDNTFNSDDFSKTIDTAIRALTTVTDKLGEETECVPSVRRGNDETHAIGLGQMNMHGFLARNYIHYDSPEAIDFTTMYFYSTLYQVLKTSNKIAIEQGENYPTFKESKYASGEFFDRFLNKELPAPTTKKVIDLFSGSTIYVPNCEDWANLKDSVMEHGIYHAYLQAVAPTGSISYVNESTSSIHPIVAPIETRKDGMLGRVYVPMPHLNEESAPYYKTAYDIDNTAIIDLYAAAQEFVDQSLSLTLFYKNSHTTRDVVKTMIYAWTKGIKTIYYARVKSDNIVGSDFEDANGFCESCQV